MKKYYIVSLNPEWNTLSMYLDAYLYMIDGKEMMCSVIQYHNILSQE